MFEGFCQGGAMAGRAVNDLMHSGKWKIRVGVVKFIDLPDDMERLLRVALPAILPKLIVMNICVATIAITMFDPGENLEPFAIPLLDAMAINAFDIVMFTFQRVIGILMIKSGRRSELYLIVALQAI